MQQRIAGLIGGMSWESSAHYYRLINEHVRDALGGTHSARLLLWSFDFAEIEALQRAGDWEGATARMIDAAQRLQAAGASCIVICTNTMHRMAQTVQDAIDIPLLHIADPTAVAAKAAGVKRIALLGTAFTMEQAFYRRRLEQAHGLQVIVPAAADRAEVHRIIYDELVQGRVLAASQAFYRQVMERLVSEGAEGVILGCTEIMMLVGQADASVPVFDTTALHARAVADHLLGHQVGRPDPA